jgi:long-subunit acyl-CoA synthetase (AMP-forming)
VCFDEYIDEIIKVQARELGINIYTFQYIIEKGKEVQKKVVLNNPTKESILTFLYTSGSTGIPKAVKITN